jgi:hypothetical protein
MVKRLLVVLVMGFWLTGCGAPDEGIERVVVMHAPNGTKIVYGYDEGGRVQLRAEGTDSELVPLLQAFEAGGHRIAYGGLCQPDPTADVAGPQPCPPGPKGTGQTPQ